MQRRSVAILAADAVGYSRLMGADEEGTLTAFQSFRNLIEAAVKKFDGRVFGGAGDSVMAEFSSPENAVQCAASFQELLESDQYQLPKSRRMLFRVGINMDDVIVDGDNLYGDGVNVAARIQQLAPPGGVVISGNVHHQIQYDNSFEFDSLGRHRFKNIAEPVLVYVLVATQNSNWSRARRLQFRWRRHNVYSKLALSIAAVLMVALVATWMELSAPETVGFPELIRPTRHFQVERPADLSDADALVIYDRIIDDMLRSYRKSELPAASSYRGWRRFNTTPYLSATHGNRYVNNYGNRLAAAYSLGEMAPVLPRGAILVKDSFEVTEIGDVLTGPIGIMEKMEPGFNAESRDWRYTMVLPDGSLFGVTLGEHSDRVQFCIDCHQSAGEDQDHLFFVSSDYRAEFLEEGR